MLPSKFVAHVYLMWIAIIYWMCARLLFFFVVVVRLRIRISCEYQLHCHKCHQRQVFIFPIIGHNENICSFDCKEHFPVYNENGTICAHGFFFLHILLHLSCIVINLTILYVIWQTDFRFSVLCRQRWNSWNADTIILKRTHTTSTREEKKTVKMSTNDVLFYCMLLNVRQVWNKGAICHRDIGLYVVILLLTGSHLFFIFLFLYFIFFVAIGHFSVCLLNKLFGWTSFKWYCSNLSQNSIKFIYWNEIYLHLVAEFIYVFQAKEALLAPLTNFASPIESDNWERTSGCLCWDQRFWGFLAFLHIWLSCWFQITLALSASRTTKSGVIHLQHHQTVLSSNLCTIIINFHVQAKIFSAFILFNQQAECCLVATVNHGPALHFVSDKMTALIPIEKPSQSPTLCPT